MYTAERLKRLIKAHMLTDKEFFHEEKWQNEFDQEAKKYIDFAAKWGQPPSIHIEIVDQAENDFWIFYDGFENKFKFKEYIAEPLF